MRASLRAEDTGKGYRSGAGGQVLSVRPRPGTLEPMEVRIAAGIGRPPGFFGGKARIGAALSALARD